MSLEVLYAAAFLLSCFAQLVLLAVLLVRRQYRTFPIFTFYIAFGILTDIGVGLLVATAAKS